MGTLYDLVDRLLMNNNEEEIYKYIRNNKNKIIFDIGCFKGKFTQKIIKLDKENHSDTFYYLFDPNPNVPHYIEKLIKNNTNINLHTNGFSDKIEKKEFYLNNFFEASGSSFQTIWKDDKGWYFSRRLLLIIINILNFRKTKKYSKIEMLTSTIDEFCQKENIEKIDLLKIDTEGHEEHVLKGAYKTLKKKIIDVIYVEVSDKKNNFNSKKKRIEDYLNKLNYKFIKEYPIKSVSLLSNLKSSDILFVKKGQKTD